MAVFDLAAFERTPLEHDPFDFLVVPGFVRKEALAALHRDFPAIENPGSFPTSELSFGPAFQAMLDEFAAPEVRRAVERKFGVDLSRRPLTATVRGRCQLKDGRIHTDSKTKIITVLIYLNPSWETPGGRLRLLRSADDLEDFAAEVPPDEGTLLAFLRSEKSFHGHKPFVGERRAIQFNWVTGKGVAWRERARHRVSAWLKRLKAAA
ncbi:MAG: 2OG-Fe(II) oxygenase [Alphaproteobacteria bacterium]